MERARVVLIGGGFWGCSTLYHLAALGVSDDVSAMDPERFGRRYATRTALRAACEGIHRNSYSLRGGRV